MNDIHSLSSGEFYIFSDVSGRPIDLCRTLPPAKCEAVIVGNTRLGVGVVLCTHSAVEITLGTNSSGSLRWASKPTRFGRGTGTFGVQMAISTGASTRRLHSSGGSLPAAAGNIREQSSIVLHRQKVDTITFLALRH